MAWYSRRFAPYVPAAARHAQARSRADELHQKRGPLKPVKIDGRAIAATFWGKAWCEHIETYSDFSNRLPRGRTYARNGSVIDLQLEPGKVRALVSGSSLYTVKVDIEPLAKPQWKALIDACAGKIESVVELLTGELSDGVMTRLCDPAKGMFPSSKQLSMSCSCPDYAALCKHLAAVLYGVGARLDQEPELFFVLRGVEKMDLLSEAAGGALAGNQAHPNELQGDELQNIFGIELDPGTPPLVPTRKSKRALKKNQSGTMASAPAKRPAHKKMGVAKPKVGDKLGELADERMRSLAKRQRVLAKVVKRGK